MKKVILGKRYRDDISGFEGVATAEYVYLNGCVRIQVTGESKDNKAPDELVFDIEQLSAVKSERKPMGKRSGGGGIREVVGR